MRIRLTKLSDVRHRLEVTRDDGSTEGSDLDSRSFLVHDFIHFGVESEAKLHGSFWGQLASGKTLPELSAAMQPADAAMVAAMTSSEAAITEAVVGVLTGVVLGRADAAAALDGLSRLFEAQERPLPVWLDEPFIARVTDRVRRLRGEWRAVPYGGSMELRFPG